MIVTQVFWHERFDLQKFLFKIDKINVSLICPDFLFCSK